VEQLTAANLELQDNLDQALAEVNRLRPLAKAREAPEDVDESYGWREEPHEVGPRMASVSPANAAKLARSILSRQQALHYAFDGSLPELAEEMCTFHPERANVLINSLRQLTQELHAVIDRDKSKTHGEPAESE
jgi:hypothetical protein